MVGVPRIKLRDLIDEHSYSVQGLRSLFVQWPSTSLKEEGISEQKDGARE